MFTKQNAARLRENLPELKADYPLDFSQIPDELGAYFSFYQFDRLKQNYAFDYHFGAISASRTQLAAHYWCLPDSRATVLVVHGLFDHVGLYLKLIERLLASNYSVIAYDLPGHGLSDGEPAAIDSFHHYGDSVRECIQAFSNVIEGPLHVIGQSTGGAALMAYMLSEQQIESPVIERAVFFAPLLRPKSWSMIKLAYACLSPFIQLFPRSFTVNSHDGDFCLFLQNEDEMQTRDISLRWINALKEWDLAFASLPISNIPLLIIQGDSDSTVDWKYNHLEIKKKFSSTEIRMIQGGLHHLANEADQWREQVFESTVTFLNQDSQD